MGRATALLIALGLGAAGCDDSATGPGPPAAPDSLPYVDEPLVLATGEAVACQETGPDEFVGIVNDSLAVDGRLDLQVRYGTSSSCDEDVFVFNTLTGAWDRIGSSPPAGIGCFAVLSTQSHLLSSLGLDAHHYLDPTGAFRLRGHVSEPSVRVLSLHRSYSPVPVLLRYSAPRGLARDGSSFWVSSTFSDRIHRVSSSGALAESFPAPGQYSGGLTFDGTHLWIVDGSNQVFRLTRDGQVDCSFTVPTDFPRALAWTGTALWLSEYASSGSQLFELESDASCAAHVARVLSTLPSPGGSTSGLAWDGEHLLVMSDKLYLLYATGGVLAEYTPSVWNVAGIAWDDATLFVLCDGPVGYGGLSDPVIVPFQLR